jgi:hypothetical protein
MRETQRHKAKRDYPESREIAAYLEWFHYQFPNIFIYKNQNEGKRHPALARKLGIQAGIPDLHIIKAVDPWHSYYIEMKLPNAKGIVSIAQKLVRDKLISEKHAVDICHGWVKAKEATLDYFNGHYGIEVSQSSRRSCNEEAI